MTVSVLFVCLGNICRSPTAEAVLPAIAAASRQGRRIVVDSAGTGGWNTGAPPHGPAVRAAAARGYTMGHLRARQVRPADFDRFDLLVAMDAANRSDLERLRPAMNATPVRLLLDHAPETGRRDVPDPYYTGDFGEALDLIEAGCAGLLRALGAQPSPSQRNA